MYNIRPNLIIGFHGCDENIRDYIVMNPQKLKLSQEKFDWLGHGFYVWENNYERALQWAKDKKKRGGIKQPSVLGVVFTLGNCLDFTDSAYTAMIQQYYQLMERDLAALGKKIPVNKDIPKDQHKDLILRELDCAVIEFLHQKIREEKSREHSTELGGQLNYFDTVRGVFTEGGPAYTGAGIQLKNHIQICIRNLNCIKALFIPRESSKFSG